MPQFILEYTDNLSAETDIPALLKKVNDTIIGQEGGIFPPGGTRSRAIELKQYRMADGVEDYAFVHVTFKIGSGRTETQKKRVCDDLFDVMKAHFAPLFATRYLALSMELYEYNEQGTYKHNNVHAKFARASVIAAFLVALAVPVAAQRNSAATAATLSAQDYLDIQQLSARYAFLIDTCANGGYDFADLFTTDGEFSVSQAWGTAGARRTKGREALADAAGGDGKGGCKDPKTTLGYGISHIVVNQVITPTPQGAIGKSYLLAIGVGGDPTKIERQGGYEDVYVKTPAGWRFQSRVHVFPNMRESVQFGPRGGGGGR